MAVVTGTYGRDTDIGRPNDGLNLEKIALALQILIEETIEDEAVGAPTDSED